MMNRLRGYWREPSFHRGAWMIAMGFLTGLFLKAMLEFLCIWPVCPHKKTIARLEAERDSLKIKAALYDSVLVKVGEWSKNPFPDTLKHKPMKRKP